RRSSRGLQRCVSSSGVVARSVRAQAGFMDAAQYDPRTTAVLFVDPYNDFLSEGGKVWPDVAPVAEAVHLLDNLRAIPAAARPAGILKVIVPHRRWRPGDFVHWRHPSPTQRLLISRKTFAQDTWGGEWHPDFAPRSDDLVVAEHWSASGFANTDLDLQLRQRG